MLKLNKLTDYAVILLAAMEGSSRDHLISVSTLSEKLHLGQATISKVLKLLNKAELIHSIRGVHGGYYLAHSLDDISVADLIEAMDGPLALTACVETNEGACCSAAGLCAIKGGWDVLNYEMIALLRSFPLTKIIHSPNTTMRKTGTR